MTNNELEQEKSYKTRGRAAPHNHMVYEKFSSSLGLNEADFSSLAKRGLTGEQISKAKYFSKPTNNSKGAIDAIAALRGENINLEGVPGFFQNDKGHWAQSGIFGIGIHVCDVEGNTSSIVVRNAKPTIKAGKPVNKYVAFSSAGKDKGARVWQTTHCPKLTGRAEDVAGTTIRLTEGVLKADVATAIGEYYTLGLQGLKVHDDLETILERLEVDTVHVCLDAGEDESPDMIKALGKIISRLQAFGVDVVVEKWAVGCGKGIDDVLLNGHTDKITHATKEEIDKMLEDAHEANPNNREWVYCIATKRFYHIDDYECLDKSQFADLFMMRTTQDVNDMIAEGFPKVNTLTFNPAQPKIIQKGRLRCLNLWKDPEIEMKEGCVQIFYDHLHFLFPRTEAELKAGEEFSQEANIVLDWMAYQVQNPGQKLNWALHIKGAEGVGKSAFEAIMGNLLGRQNVREVNNEELHDKYTDFMKGAMLIVVHEMMSRGRLDTMNKIKPLITQDTVQIREMYTPTYTQENVANFLLFSNYADAILVDKGDRRYCVIWTEAKLFKEEKDQLAYYGPLWDWIRSDDMASHLTWHLMKRDLSKFNPKSSAPMTKWKEEAIKVSRTNFEAFIEDSIADEAWPFSGDVVSIRHLMDQRVCPRQFQNFSPHKWAEALKSAGAIQHPTPVKLSDGTQTRFWVLRNWGIHLSEINHGDKVGIHLKKQFESNTLNEEPGGNPLIDLEAF